MTISSYQDLTLFLCKVYMEVFFVLGISADSVEMLHKADSVAFRLGLHCLLMYPFIGFQTRNWLKLNKYDIWWESSTCSYVKKYLTNAQGKDNLESCIDTCKANITKFIT